MSNFNSSDIEVFPSTFRVSNPNGKFTSEKNFVNILNSLADYNGDGYVLNYSNGILEVVIHGYYFKANIGQSMNTLYLSILVEDYSGCLVDYTTKSPNTLDKNNEFTGLWYTNTKPTQPVDSGYTRYTLLAIEGGKVVNMFRMSADHVLYGNDKSVKEVLDSKQGNLTAVYPIEIDGSNTIKFDTAQHLYPKFSDLGTAGSDTQPVKFVNGKPIAISGNAGYFNTASGNTRSSRSTILVDGKITGGQTIYASTESPSNSLGSNGDLWFKYS